VRPFQPANNPIGPTGHGFLGVHDGRGGNFVFVDLWEEENELHHHVVFSTAADPGPLRRATSADPIACVWDLSVIAHECAAWIRHVLGAEAPDLDAYLEDQLNGEISASVRAGSLAPRARSTPS
jgi:hypothetical protein